MNDFTIWVDADACPKLAKNIILTSAKKTNLKVTYVANREIPFEIQSENFTCVVCPKIQGSADDYIVDHAKKNDIVITRDLPFAERLVKKNICVMNDRGVVFDKKNIIPLLKERELNMQLVSIGVNCGKKYSSYDKKEAALFADSFNKLLTEKINLN